MDHHRTTFFCDKGKQPKVEIDSGEDWKFLVKIDDSISIFIKDLEDLSKFKESLDKEYLEVANE